MHKKIWKFDLQFFADGAAGGDGAGSGASAGVAAADAGQPGVNSAAAGQTKTLEELGVPKEKAERYRAKKGVRAVPPAEQVVAAPAVNAEPAVQGNTVPAAEQVAAADTPAAPQGITWDEAMKNPEFNRKMQETVNLRVKKMQAMFDGLSPALEVLGKKYGFDTSDLSKLDVKSFSEAITGDSSYYEAAAADLGTDVQTAMRVRQKESQAERATAQAERTMQEIKMRQHFEKLRTDAEALKKDIPAFDLDKELQNPQFLRMTSPEGGLSVAQAYHALHYKEIAQARAAQTARDVAQALSNSIQSGRQMPQENGATAKSASSVMPKLYSQMNPAERAEYKRRLQKGR